MWSLQQLYRFSLIFFGILILGFTGNPQVGATSNPTLLGSMGGAGAVHDIHTVAGYAYTVGTNGLEIVDVSSPTALEKIGFLRLPGSPENLYVSGTTAYVAADSYLHIIDVTNPASPQLLASYETPSHVYGLHASESTAYVAGDFGLHVIDVSNPASPQLLGEYGRTGDVNGLYVSGSTAYLANGNFGLRVIDVSNPESPKLLNTYKAPGPATDVYVSGTTAYVAADSYLHIIDVTDPASPQVLANYETPGGVDEVYVSGSTAYVVHGFYWDSKFSAYFGGRLHVIDVTNPASPQLLGSYTISDVNGLYVSESTAYVASDFGLYVIDVANRASPQLLASYYGLESATDVCISETTAYVVTGSYPELEKTKVIYDTITMYPPYKEEPGYLQIINVADPASPQLLASSLSSDVYDAYVSGNIVYVVDSHELQVIDVANPASPDLVGKCDTLLGTEIYVSGTTAYIAYAEFDMPFLPHHNPGLHVIDVSNPASPQLLASYETPSHIYGLHASESTAYVAGDFGLHVIDVSNPASPQLLGEYGTTGDVNGLYVSGSTAYLANGNFGLRVIDVSNPESPKLLNTYKAPGEATDVYISGTTAYVGYRVNLSSGKVGDSGLCVIDVSNPASLQLLGSYDRLHDAAGLYVSGDIAYVADVGSGLQIIDVGNSRNTDGDVAPLGNRDGIVNVGDALVALRFALTLEIPTSEDIVHGDVAPLDEENKPSPDGVINVGDALVILRKALGIISF